MQQRKKLIEDILSSIHAFGQRCKTKPELSGQKPQITHSQWYVLSIIEHSKSVSVKEIAQILGISPSAITQLVDGLVDSEIVTRSENPTDRRTTQLSLSTKGLKQIQTIKKEKMEVFATLFEALSDSELTTYHRLQQKLLKQINSR